MDDEGLAGKVAVVTGAAQGIGAAVAAALARRGAIVAALDLQECAGVRPPGIRNYRCDVTDAARVDDVIAAVERELGPIGLLANVAGVLHTGTVADTGPDEWQRPFAVNTTGVYTVSRAVTAAMIPRASGAVVTVASNAAGIPRAGMAAYAASKAAAMMFTKCLGLEVAAHGIRCNVVNPGSTDTAMQRGMWAGPSGEAAVIRGSLADYKTGIPLGRIADADDVADAVVYLLSDRARHVTMHDLYVDGGATLRG